MKRRDFLKAAGVSAAWPATTAAQPSNAAPSDRDVWVAITVKVADGEG